MKKENEKKNFEKCLIGKRKEVIEENCGKIGENENERSTKGKGEKRKKQKEKKKEIFFYSFCIVFL